MECLQTLKIKVDDDSDIKQLLRITNNLEEITMISYSTLSYNDLFKHWKEEEFRPPMLNIIACSITDVVNCSTQLTTIPTSVTANFTVFSKYCKVPLNFSPSHPYLQVKVHGSGNSAQVTTPFVKLSDFGILGLRFDEAVVNDFKCSGRTMYGVRTEICKSRLTHNIQFDLKCVTHFDMIPFNLLYSGHLEQLAIACPNLQRLSVRKNDRYLECLKGLQCIASKCHNLRGLYLLGICGSKVESCILL